MLRQHAARKDADAEAKIPCGEIGGRGRAALGMGAKVDEQGIERREGRTEPQTAAQGDDQESDSRVTLSLGIAIMAQA